MSQRSDQGFEHREQFLPCATSSLTSLGSCTQVKTQPIYRPIISQLLLILCRYFSALSKACNLSKKACLDRLLTQDYRSTSQRSDMISIPSVIPPQHQAKSQQKPKPRCWDYGCNGREPIREGRSSLNAGIYQCIRSANQPPESNSQLVLASTLNSSFATVNFSSFSPRSPSFFKPHAIPANMASLNIDGNLDAMSRCWTQEEMDAKRRIVEFKRQQNGTLISTTFRPVTLEQGDTDGIYVSCILREEEHETYITSVDIFRLLERLLGVIISGKTRTRIRRNMVRSKPLMVTKDRPGTEKLFDLIMGFPYPSPREEHRPLKVFPWETLATILQKIIGECEIQKRDHDGTSDLIYHVESFDPIASSLDVLSAPTEPLTFSVSPHPTSIPATFCEIEPQPHRPASIYSG